MRELRFYTFGSYYPTKYKGMWCFSRGERGESEFGVVHDNDSSLTYMSMEYLAVIRLLESLEPGTSFTVLSNSSLLIDQLSGHISVSGGHLLELNRRVWTIINEKHLDMSLEFVKRLDNRSRKMVEPYIDTLMMEAGTEITSIMQSINSVKVGTS